MNILEFEIHGQVLTRVDSQDVVNKNHNIYKCQFTFEENSEWDNANKFVIFTDGWGNSSTQHLGKSSNVLSCMIPDRMLKGSYFKISVYGGDLVTTNNLSISLIQSGYQNNYPHHDIGFHKHPHYHHLHPKPKYHPKEDIFVEIFDRLDKTFDSLVYDNSTLHLYCRDELIESVYLPFVTAEDINDLLENITEDYFNNHIQLASSESDGLLSSTDKVKLDGIEEGANRIIVDDALDTESTNPISNQAVTNEFNNLDDEIDRLDNALMGKEDKYDIVERIDNVIVNLINNGE